MNRPSRRTIKIPNAERLKNAALFYLSRYAASEASLRRVLHNRLRRAKMAHPDFAADDKLQAELNAVIEQIIETHKKTGAVNDAFIAEMKVASLRRSGRSQRFIRLKLAERGLGKDLIDRTLKDYDGTDDDESGTEQADMKAALAYIKRRRLGSFRSEAKKKEGDQKRDFAALARAGFSATIILKALHVGPEDEPEAWD